MVDWMRQLNLSGDAAQQLPQQPQLQPSYGYNVVINSCQRLCDAEGAKLAASRLHLFEYPRDVFTCTALIDVVARDGDVAGAIEIYKSMCTEGPVPNAITYSTTIRGVTGTTRRWTKQNQPKSEKPVRCATLEALQVGMDVLEDAVAAHCDEPLPFVDFVRGCTFCEDLAGGAQLADRAIQMAIQHLSEPNDGDQMAAEAAALLMQLDAVQAAQLGEQWEQLMKLTHMQLREPATVTGSDGSKQSPLAQMKKSKKKFGCLEAGSIRLRTEVVGEGLTRLCGKLRTRDTVSIDDFLTLVHTCRKRKWGSEIERVLQSMQQAADEFGRPDLVPTASVYVAVLESYVAIHAVDDAEKMLKVAIRQGMQLPHETFQLVLGALLASTHVQRAVDIFEISQQQADVDPDQTDELFWALVTSGGADPSALFPLLEQFPRTVSGSDRRQVATDCATQEMCMPCHTAYWDIPTIQTPKPTKCNLMATMINSCAHLGNGSINSEGAVAICDHFGATATNQENPAANASVQDCMDLQLGVLSVCVGLEAFDEAATLLEQFQRRGLVRVPPSAARSVLLECMEVSKQGCSMPLLWLNKKHAVLAHRVAYFESLLTQPTALAVLEGSHPPETDSSDLQRWSWDVCGTLPLAQLLVRLMTAMRSSQDYETLVAQLQEVNQPGSDPVLRALQVVVQLSALGAVTERLQVKVLEVMLSAWGAAEYSAGADATAQHRAELEGKADQLCFEVIITLFGTLEGGAFNTCPELLIRKAATEGKVGRTRTARAVKLLLHSCKPRVVPSLNSALTKSLVRSYLQEQDCVLVDLCTELQPESAQEAFDEMLRIAGHESKHPSPRHSRLHGVAAREACRKFAQLFGLGVPDDFLLQPAMAVRVTASAEESTEESEGCLDIEIKSILLVDCVAKLAEAREVLLTCEADAPHVVGVDAEWLPASYQQPALSSVAVLQMSTGSKAVVFDLLQDELLDHPETAALMDELMQARHIYKLGYGLKEDLKRLRTLRPTLRCFDSVHSVVDLQQLQSGGLSKLCIAVTSKRLDKRQQCSDWENRPLSLAQLKYAALDARCLVKIYHLLSTVQLDGLQVTDSIVST